MWPSPPHARVWGVDSGVRHSVEGSDYGAVRVGECWVLLTQHLGQHMDGEGVVGLEASALLIGRAAVGV